MERIAQQHRRREDRPERVCDPLPCDVGRTAVNRLKETRARPDRRRRHETDRAADHRRLIRENITEEIARHDDIELCRAHGKLHGAVIDVEMIELHIRIVLCQSRHRTSPEARRCQHVRLVHRRDLGASETRRLKRKARDTLYLGHGVVLHIPCALHTVHMLALALLAEVNAADQLAHNDEIDTAHEIGLQRRVLDERIRHLDRTQIRIESEPLAQAKDGAFGAQRRLHRIPLRPADRTKEHAVRCLAYSECILGQRCPIFIIRRAARIARLIGKSERERCIDGLQDAYRLTRDLLPDAVARDNRNLIPHDGIPRSP